MRDLTVATTHIYYVIVGTTPVLVHNNNEEACKVFRVEAREGANQRIEISANGGVSILKPENMIFLNFGNTRRATEYLARRQADPRFRDSVVRQFEVDQKFLERLRNEAVPEDMAGDFPESPLVVDLKHSDQFGLRPKQITQLRGAIVPSSGIVRGSM